MTENSAARDAWTAATELLLAEGNLTQSQLAFIRLSQPLAIMENEFIIGVATTGVKDWISQHVAPVILPQLSAILGKNLELGYSVDPSLKPVSTSNNHLSNSAVSHTTNEQFSGKNNSNDVSNSEFISNSSNNDLTNNEPTNTPFLTSGTETNTLGNNTFPSVQPAGNIPTPHTHSIVPADNSHISSRNIPINYTGNIPGQFTSGLNPRYTFDNFVIGESNRFAHATAFAVSEAPGTIYNPLFFYSDSGMGKTHLLHAIGNYVLHLFPNKKVRYISSEEFINLFVNAVTSPERAEKFKQEFRTVDVLLIDDIQQLLEKEGTILEFFHTFNVLWDNNKQIVITSDTPPTALAFEERMTSRFASGITASIDLPNLETRIAILEKKNIAENMKVSDDIIEFIASKITTNVRELEAGLRRIAAYTDLNNAHMTVELANSVIHDLLSDESTIRITAGTILAETAKYFDITVADLKSPTRTRTLTIPRHVAMYLCREMTDLSLPKIAEIFDRRDHTTVLNALRKIEELMTKNQTQYNQVTELSAKIKAAAKQQAAIRNQN